jgi:hypothetical protein
MGVSSHEALHSGNHGATGPDALDITTLGGFSGPTGAIQYNNDGSLGAAPISYDGNKLTATKQIAVSEQTTLTPTGPTGAIDWNDGNSITIDLGGGPTADLNLEFSNPQSGASYFLKFIQGPTARDVVLPSDVLTPGGTAPTTLNITEVNDAVDSLALYYDGTNYLAQFNQNYG